MNLKTTALITLFVLLMNWATPVFSFADDLICFPPEGAVSLLTDVIYCKEELPKLNEKVKLLDQSNKLQESDLTQYKIKTDLLIQDKAALSKSSDTYKELYTKTANEKDELEKSTPSRATWFTAGAITSAILFITGFFAIK